MSVLVLLSGLYVALIAGSSGGIQLFGWFLVLVGIGGVLVGLWARRRTRS